MFDPVSYLMGKEAGGGSSVTVEALTVTENGTVTAPTGKAYSPVTVDVPLNVGIESTITGSLNSFFNNRTFVPAINKLTFRNFVTSSVIATYCFSQLKGVSELDITLDGPVSNLQGAFYGCRAKRVVLNLDTSTPPQNYKQLFYDTENVEGLEIIVTGYTFDLSAVPDPGNNNNGLQNMIGANVKEIRFVKSSAKTDWLTNQCQKVSDETLVSMANALDETATGKTLSIHATPKARCGQLVGTVTDGVFAIDAGGGTTLADFITNTKGWTLA